MLVRTFLALPLDDGIQGRLVAAQESLASAGARVRWVARENLHLTVKFLGGVEDRALGEVCAAAKRSAGEVEPFAFAVRGLSAVPNAGPLRMIWAGIDDPTGRLGSLNELLEKSFAALGFKEEKRAFRPHLTLGRVKGGRNASQLRAAAGEWRETDFGEQPAEELIVFSSELTPDGPIYTALSRAPLAGA